MPNEGERVAVLETILAGLRTDVHELVEETLRTRKRLHDLEGIAATLVGVDRQRRKDEQRREKKYTRRLNLIAVLAAVAASVSPIIVALLHHG